MVSMRSRGGCVESLVRAGDGGGGGVSPLSTRGIDSGASGDIGENHLPIRGIRAGEVLEGGGARSDGVGARGVPLPSSGGSGVSMPSTGGTRAGDSGASDSGASGVTLPNFHRVPFDGAARTAVSRRRWRVPAQLAQLGNQIGRLFRGAWHTRDRRGKLWAGPRGGSHVDRLAQGDEYVL